MSKGASIRRRGLAACLAIAMVSAACAAPVESEHVEATSESSDELVWVAVPVYLTWQQIAGFVLVGGGLAIANYQFQTAVRETDFSSNAAARAYDREVRTENDFLLGRYRTGINARLNVPSNVTPNLWIQQFGYSREVAGNVATASRQLIRLSKTSRFRNNGGGCVIATVKHESGTPFTGGAPFSGEFDIVAAQFSAAARAYTRCAKFDPDTIDALKELIPDSPLEATPDTFITYGIKSARFLDTVRRNCNALTFAITSNKAACR
jgi:hypothetical protein